MKYTTVLFDADDTLLDFKKSERTAISAVLSELGLPTDEHTIKVYSEINDSLWKLLEVGGIKKEVLKVERFRRLCEHFGFEVSPDRMAERYMDALSEQSYLVDTAESVCRSIYNAKIRMYIITNGIKTIQSRRLAATPIAQLFDGVFISEEIGYEKPRREFFDRATSMIEDFDISKTLVVGDSLTSDIKGGIDYGIDTCWYNPKQKARPDGVNMTYEITELCQVLDVLEI